MGSTLGAVGVSLALSWMLVGCDNARPNRGPDGAAGYSGGSAGAQAASGAGGSLGGGTGASGDNGLAGVNVAGGAGALGDSGLAPGSLRDFLGDPAYPDAYWQAASAGDRPIDEAPLQDALRLIQSSAWEIHSFLVAQRGRLVFERYGWDSGTSPVSSRPHQVLPDERQLQFSTTKSFLSALVGIALSEGAFGSLAVHAADYFPDYADLNPSPEKSSITLETLLTMRSGLDFMEGDQSTFATPDPARAAFSKRVTDTPVGTVWNYSSGGANIVAEMLRVATGKTPLEYANEKLFGRIGIESPPWAAGQSGTNFGGFGLELTAREMARFGELFRNSGKWQGQAVVPSAWTDESTAPRCPSPWGGQYGYFWWIPVLPGFFNSNGAFGQMIYVNRERELVIVFTANMANEVAKNNLERLIRDYVLPATR